jgi:hypothetical protein
MRTLNKAVVRQKGFNIALMPDLSRLAVQSGITATIRNPQQSGSDLIDGALQKLVVALLF